MKNIKKLLYYIVFNITAYPSKNLQDFKNIDERIMDKKKK